MKHFQLTLVGLVQILGMVLLIGIPLGAPFSIGIGVSHGNVWLIVLGSVLGFVTMLGLLYMLGDLSNMRGN